MKYLSYLSLVITLFVCISCGYNQKKTTAPAYSELVLLDKDTTLYVVLDNAEGSNLDVTTLETGESYQLDATKATEEELVRGDLTVGDTLAVTFNHDTNVLNSCVNISELIGLWISDDGSGVRLNANGTVQTIGDLGAGAREWCIHNGKFVISYLLVDGEDQILRADTTGILSLDDDELEFSVAGLSHMAKKQVGLLTNDDFF